MKSSLDDCLASIEAFSTSISDSNAEWWPFSFLRPEQHERLEDGRCLLIAILHGVPLALLALIIGNAIGDDVTSLHLLIFPAAVCALYFAVFRTTLAYFWNRRADRLRPLQLRQAKWRKELSEGPDRTD